MGSATQVLTSNHRVALGRLPDLCHVVHGQPAIPMGDGIEIISVDCNKELTEPPSAGVKSHDWCKLMV
jgi:hypothetical protein